MQQGGEDASEDLPSPLKVGDLPVSVYNMPTHSHIVHVSTWQNGPQGLFAREKEAWEMAAKVKVLLVLIISVLVVQEGVAADCNYADILKTHWKRTQKMMTIIVPAMPEDKWDFRPVEEVRTFREMAKHLITDGISHTGWAASTPKPHHGAQGFRADARPSCPYGQ